MFGQCGERPFAPRSPSPTVSTLATAGTEAPLRVGDTIELTGVVTEDGEMFVFVLQSDGGAPTMPVVVPAGTMANRG
jgi:hypothetical protein